MLLKGAPVAAGIDENTAKRAEVLKARGIKPTIAVIRMGEKPDDIYYEKSALKRAEKLGITAISAVLASDASQADVERAVEACSKDPIVHGILLLRPLEKHIDEAAVIAKLAPEKDIDGITPASLAGVFSGSGAGYPPCTAEACMRMLKHYEIELSGKSAVVIGRSLVVGKPLSMLLLAQNATVTICHTRTRELARVCSAADILIAAAGRAKMVDASFTNPSQVVLDVGINVDENGKMTGDADAEAMEGACAMITPVPGGVGSVTTSVLLESVVSAAEKTLN